MFFTESYHSKTLVSEYDLYHPIWFADPNIMKKLQVDRGAIKFVLAGANIMCPGLTSPGGALDDEVEAETPVVNYFLLLSADSKCRLLVQFCVCWVIITFISRFWGFVWWIPKHFQAIMAEGKQHALAIGFTKMSAKEMWVKLLFNWDPIWWWICFIFENEDLVY